MSEYDRPHRRRRFDDDDPPPARRRRPATREPEAPPETGDRWSTWDLASAGDRGPSPRPQWLVTESAAVDIDHGVLKTGKEADVHLVERAVPGTDRSCLLAAKRYRDREHRMFHRDAGYLEGRRVRRSRENRAMARRTSFGREVIAGQWAAAEFRALCRLWTVGEQAGMVLVPYPVQLVGSELMMEFIGDPVTGRSAPRLDQLRPDLDQLTVLWDQLVTGMCLLARLGLAHGDLSAYNIMVHEGHPVLIDLPQVVDVVTNPRGPEFLARDARVVAGWFSARGLAEADPVALSEMLMSEAHLR